MSRLGVCCGLAAAYLAMWSASHVFPGDGDPFFVELEEVYDQMAGAPHDAVRSLG
jgi:hypothetical protein